MNRTIHEILTLIVAALVLVALYNVVTFALTGSFPPFH